MANKNSFKIMNETARDVWVYILPTYSCTMDDVMDDPSMYNKELWKEYLKITDYRQKINDRTIVYLLRDDLYRACIKGDYQLSMRRYLIALVRLSSYLKNNIEPNTTSVEIKRYFDTTARVVKGGAEIVVDEDKELRMKGGDVEVDSGGKRPEYHIFIVRELTEWVTIEGQRGAGSEIVIYNESVYDRTSYDRKHNRYYEGRDIMYGDIDAVCYQPGSELMWFFKSDVCWAVSKKGEIRHLGGIAETFVGDRNFNAGYPFRAAVVNDGNEYWIFTEQQCYKKPYKGSMNRDAYDTRDRWTSELYGIRAAWADEQNYYTFIVGEDTYQSKYKEGRNVWKVKDTWNHALKLEKEKGMRIDDGCVRDSTLYIFAGEYYYVQRWHGGQMSWRRRKYSEDFLSKAREHERLLRHGK